MSFSFSITDLQIRSNITFAYRDTVSIIPYDEMPERSSIAA